MSPAAKRFAEGLGEGPDPRAAVAEAAARARAGLGSAPCDLALAFVCDAWEGFAPGELPALLARELAPRRVLGVNAAGVICGRREREGRPAAAVLAMSLPGAEVRTFSLSARELGALGSGTDLVAALDLYPTESPKFLVFADPKGLDAERLAALLNEAYPGAPVLGGLGSAAALGREGWLLQDASAFPGGAVLAALTGDVEFETVVAQGCRPIGSPWIVTRADGNVLLELGGRPPLEVLRQTLADCAPGDRKLAREALFAGLLMDERRGEGGGYLARGLLGFDAQSGAVAVGALLRRGQTLQFQLRDARASDDDLRRLLQCLPRADGAAAGGFLASCCGRGAGLYGEPDHDAALIQSLRGPLPLAGFFAAGEFGPVGGRNFVHGFTSALALIR